MNAAKAVGRNFREFGERTVKVKWVIPAYLLIAMTAFGVGFAVLRDSADQRETSARLAAEAQYAAEVASFENARDELSRCLQRVESRAQLRLAFNSIFDLIDRRADDAGTPSTFGAEARMVLDEDYPAIGPETCPPSPDAPIPPPSLTRNPND